MRGRSTDLPEGVSASAEVSMEELQLSQRAHLADLEPADRAAVEAAGADAAAPPQAAVPSEHH